MSLCWSWIRVVISPIFLRTKFMAEEDSRSEAAMADCWKRSVGLGKPVKGE